MIGSAILRMVAKANKGTLYNLDKIEELIPKDKMGGNTSLYKSLDNMAVAFTDMDNKAKVAIYDEGAVVIKDVSSKSEVEDIMNGYGKEDEKMRREILSKCDADRVLSGERKRDLFRFISEFGDRDWGEYFKVLLDMNLVRSRKELLSFGAKGASLYRDCKTLFVTRWKLGNKIYHLVGYNPEFILEQAIETYRTYSKSFRSLSDAYMYVAMFMFYHELGHVNLLHIAEKNKQWGDMSFVARTSAMEATINTMVKEIMNGYIWHPSTKKMPELYLRGHGDPRPALGTFHSTAVNMDLADDYLEEDIADVINEYLHSYNVVMRDMEIPQEQKPFVPPTGVKTGKRRVMLRVGFDMDHLMELFGVNSPLVGWMLEGFFHKVTDGVVVKTNMDFNHTEVGDVVNIKGGKKVGVVIEKDIKTGKIKVMTARNRSEATSMAGAIIKQINGIVPGSDDDDWL